MSRLLELLGAGGYPMIGMVQLPPLPGASTYRDGALGEIIDGALEECEALVRVGMDAVMVQNLGDLPVDHHVVPSQLAWMTRVASEVRRQASVPVGLNFLENDAEAMFACATAASLDFVRVKVFVGVMVTPFGLAGGAAHSARKARNLLGAHDVAILADVHDRTGIHLGGRALEEDIRDAVDLGGADALVLTGSSYAESLEFLKAGRARAPGTPRLLGGGATSANIREVLSVADGAIVSSSLKDSGSAFGRIDPAKADAFMKEVDAARKQPSVA